jgi:hypothetical protein
MLTKGFLLKSLYSLGYQTILGVHEPAAAHDTDGSNAENANELEDTSQPLVQELDSSTLSN